MSIKAMNWAWGIGLPPAVKLVLLKLADRANDDLECWAGQSSIAEHCSMSERSVMRHIDTLERAGIIKVERRKDEFGRQATNLYLLDFSYKPGDKLSPGETDEPGDNQGKSRVTSVSPVLKEEPKEEPKDTRARKPQKPKSPFILPAWLDPDVWQQFVDHRQAIKSKLTDQSARLAIRKLDTLRRGGSPPGAVIEQTVLNGWTGLFPIRPQFATGRTGALSEADLLRIGNELGIDPKPGESTWDYAARIDQARQQFANQTALPHPPAANRTFP